MAKRTPRRAYSDVAERVLAAVRELNAAMDEAYEHPQTKVHLSVPSPTTGRVQFGCEVTRITKHAVVVEGDEIKPGLVAREVAKNTGTLQKATKSSAKKAKKSRARKAA